MKHTINKQATTSLQNNQAIKMNKQNNNPQHTNHQQIRKQQSNPNIPNTQTSQVNQHTQTISKQRSKQSQLITTYKHQVTSNKQQAKRKPKPQAST